MTLFPLVLVALVQGATEFVPVSSSGHLVLLPLLTGQPDQGLMIDVAVHVGTLAAVLLYFRADVAGLVRGLRALMGGNRHAPEARLAGALIVATIPVMAAGLALKLLGVMDALRSVAVIGWTTLVFGLLLGLADRVGAHGRSLSDWTLSQAVILGLWQALALIPGTSRSGICITGARLMGFGRIEAARVAMLMSIPTLIASGGLQGLELIASGDRAQLGQAAMAALLAFGAGLVALALMMRLLRSVSFRPYVYYRIALGAGLLAFAYG
jgi:undecaprenyl-diphosphatase